MTATGGRHLIDALPPVRGRLRADVPLAPVTWFRAGGRAEAVFEPADLDDLAAFLALRPEGVPVTAIGVGSNLLVRDGGVGGVVVRLGGPLARVEVEGERLRAGAGVLDRTVAGFAQRAGLSGLEFYVGIPGTIGGALRMNAGAFGGETAAVVERVTALDERGRRHELTAAELGFSYRHSGLPEGWITTHATLRAVPGDAGEIAARMAAIKAEREVRQPVRVATGGSTFKNPPGMSAWRLIDAAGCRGLRRGAAVVSDRHCNFLVNTGGASAAEIEALGEEVRARVRAHSGVELEWEIRRIGHPGDSEARPRNGLEAAA